MRCGTNRHGTLRSRLVLPTILLLSAVLLLLPAAANAGGFRKLFKMSKSQELSIAQEMNTELAKDPGLVTKGKQYDEVQRIGQRLVKANALKQYDYKFFLTKDDEVNAFCTPGGYVYVTSGLLKYMAYDESMLAAVMAHELGHAKDRHVAKGYEKMLSGALGLGVLGIALGKQNQDITKALGTAGGVVMLKYNRDQEEWADRAGVELTYGAGYDAYGLLRSLQCLEALYGSSDNVTTWLSNHPATKDRITRVTAIARELCGKEQGYRSIPVPPKDNPLYKLYGASLKGTSPVVSGPADENESQGDAGSSEKYKKGNKQTSPVK